LGAPTSAKSGKNTHKNHTYIRISRMDDDSVERRRQWEAIRQREQERRRNIESLRQLMTKVGADKKTAKTLLKLVVYTEGVKSSEAADILGVRREVLDTWVRILLSKGFVDVESMNHPNPTIRPTREILLKFRAFQSRSQAQDMQNIDEGISGMGERAQGLEAEEKHESAQPAEPDGGQPAAEADVGEGLDSGVTYLVYDQKSENSIRLYIREIRKGVKGLFVTRSNPNHVKKKYYLADSRVVWLTSVQADKELQSISGLQELSILVSKFIDDNPQSVILLEGIEYLVSNNNFPVVLRLIQQLRDKVSTSDSKMLLPINPSALDDRQMPLLESECQILR
jgi:hypothetical protein